MEWSGLTDEQAHSFAVEALHELAQQRDDLARGIADVDRELEALQSASVSAKTVRTALSNVAGIYECLQPYERKELIRLLLQRAEVSERRIVLEIRAGLEELPGRPAIGDKRASRAERLKWLPDEDSNLEPSG